MLGTSLIFSSPRVIRRPLPRGDGVCNVMLSAAGRRVSLMRLLQQSISEMELRGGVLAMDITLSSAAMQLADECVVVPPYRDPRCLDALLELCTQYSLRLIVPTIDTELAFYAHHARAFREAGCAINISSPETIEIGGDKQRTHEWLCASGFPTVSQWPLQTLLDTSELPEFPLIVKPRFGSSSIGITIAHERRHLESRALERALIVQSIAKGQEYTVDVFVDRKGCCRCAVPRRRLETRGGEVSKGLAVTQREVADLACRVAESLPGAYGVLNIQIFLNPESAALSVIEINPRFGGGYPLSHEAGATMTRWLLEDVLNRPSTARADLWRPNLVMLRYDEAVFVDVSRTSVT